MKWEYQKAIFDNPEDIILHVYKINKGEAESGGSLAYKEGVGAIRAIECIAFILKVLEKRVSKLENDIPNTPSQKK